MVGCIRISIISNLNHMNGKDFSEKIYERIVVGGLREYKKIFSTDRTLVKNAFWKNLLSLHDKLGLEDQKKIVALIYQVSVDSVAETLSVLDNSASLSGQEEGDDLTLASKKDGVISGELHDYFLEKDELSREYPL